MLTITNSFMTQSEISANYGKVFANVSGSDGKAYIADEVNLKFIPDKVTFHQYISVLIRSPDYLLKFWNSVILVVPIVLLQLAVASLVLMVERYTLKGCKSALGSRIMGCSTMFQ